MAKKKKKENTLSYLQMPLPEGVKYSKMTKVSFGGLNNRYTLDSGELSMESNISTKEYPYLTPSEKRTEVFGTDDKPYYIKSGDNETKIPISMFAFDNFLVVVYDDANDDAIKVDYIVRDESSNNANKFTVYTGILKQGTTDNPITDEDLEPRSIVQFNVFDGADVVSGTFTKGLLIFPDQMSMYFDVTEDEETDDESRTFKLYSMNDTEKAIVTPPIKYATVHLSRVFGVSDDCVFASGFNDYTNWALDTVDDGTGDDGYDETNAWMSQTQSNTKAGGNFTGITAFQGHVVCFKRDFMHEIYNNKNPFRLVDIYPEGAVDNRTIQDVDGKLMFVSEDDVKVYTGSNPRIIGYNLNMPRYEYAVSGTDNRNYYLYCEDKEYMPNKYLYVYDTYTDMWSEQSIDNRVLSFAHNKNGMYMLCDNGVIYQMDSGSYDHEWSFETDIITNKTVNIKHIKKLQMLVETDDKTETNFQVYILYDNETFDALTDDEKAKRLAYSSGKLGKYPVRVKPRNTANYGFRLRFEGKGYVKLYELEIFVESGGDLYVG